MHVLLVFRAEPGKMSRSSGTVQIVVVSSQPSFGILNTGFILG